MNIYEIIIIIILIITILSSSLCCVINNVSRKRSKLSILENVPITYKKYNIIKNICMRYINQIDNEDYYLTWRYAGEDLLHNATYNLILLSYKNAQNSFMIHYEDSQYLKQFYEKYNLYNDFLEDQLNEIVFITSEYNVNKDQYLELEEHPDTNGYIIKASLWSKKGPNSYVHIDDKNKLYFDVGINRNIAMFEIE